MLETLVNPKKAERRPWEMFFIGALYATVSLFIADFLFLKNPVFEKHISILIVFFTVMFSIPFFFYIIKIEEEKDTKIKSEKKLIKEHGKAISALLFLFLGYVVAFALLFALMPMETTSTNFKIQVETYCMVNARFGYEECVEGHLTGDATELRMKVPSIKNGMSRVSTILSNNFYVLLFSLLFSFLFGAGAIFILAWNGSVIAAAIAIFARDNLAQLPLGFLRYLIHGLPEIASYFIVALAGGIIGTAVIRHEFGHEKFWHVLQDSLDLIIIALLVLIISAFMEVFLTPALF
ncbi:MAG: stage II sporulation protein M [Candidatus Pacearchaeota archaeon]|nr:MAG: stage II sporulation protein M [Candidatus Pacearchaeota archaeon]